MAHAVEARRVLFCCCNRFFMIVENFPTDFLLGKYELKSVKNYGKFKFQNESINSRVLEVGIPKGATKSQREQMNRAVKYAKEQGVELNIRVVK